MSEKSCAPKKIAHQQETRKNKTESPYAMESENLTAIGDSGKRMSPSEKGGGGSIERGSQPERLTLEEGESGGIGANWVIMV
jgi:hypothetical protein